MFAKANENFRQEKKDPAREPDKTRMYQGRGYSNGEQNAISASS
jgi:hypothetical protein